MKTAALLTLLALGASSVSAAAVADAEAQWCKFRGEPCWKVKRTADAFAEAVASAGGLAGSDNTNAVARRSNMPGGLADNAKRALDGLAGIVASTQHSPRSYYSSLRLGSYFPPPPPPPPETDDVEKREADADAEAQWCQFRGEPCWKAKRAAEASPEADAEAQWCKFRGEPCWKVKRAAEAVVSTIDGFASAAQSPAKRAAEAEAEPQWCHFRGEPCWKRSVEARCNAPDGACAAARRDLQAMYLAARSVLDTLPEA